MKIAHYIVTRRGKNNNAQQVAVRIYVANKAIFDDQFVLNVKILQ